VGPASGGLAAATRGTDLDERPPREALHMATTPTLEVAVKTEISKLNSYMSLRGDDGRGGLRP
jgi:hypothetical protein